MTTMVDLLRRKSTYPREQGYVVEGYDYFLFLTF